MRSVWSRVGVGLALVAAMLLSGVMGRAPSWARSQAREDPPATLPGPLVAPTIVPPEEEPPRLAPRAGPAITFQERVLELVNQERLANGNLPPLKGVDELDAAAGTHSFNMADRDFFAHCDLDTGTSPFDRMTAAGYVWNFAGENIAAGFSTPELVMEGWMDSPGHRANILHTDFREIGIGYEHQESDQANVRLDQDGNCVADTFNQGPFFHYWTQSFGRRNSVFPLVINREAHATICADAALYVYGPSNATQMRFSSDGSSWSPFEPFAHHKTWALVGAAGSSTTVFSEVTDGVTIFPGQDWIFLGADFPAPAVLNVPFQTVSFTATFQACHTVSATDGFHVTGAGDVTFRAGQRVILGDGFSVATGGTFRAVVDPNL